MNFFSKAISFAVSICSTYFALTSLYLMHRSFSISILGWSGK